MIVGIDSMVLIYAGMVPVLNKSKTSKQFEELSIRAKMLLDTLANDEADIILSAVAISELLVPVPLERHGKLLAELSKHFICQPRTTSMPLRLPLTCGRDPRICQPNKNTRNDTS